MRTCPGLVLGWSGVNAERRHGHSPAAHPREVPGLGPGPLSAWQDAAPQVARNGRGGFLVRWVLSGGRSTRVWEKLGEVQVCVIKCTNEKREPSRESSLQNMKFC